MSDLTVQREMRVSADAAHREAAREAVERIRAESKPDLDIGLPDHTSTLVAGD